MEIRKPKGTNDILPKESIHWQKLEMLFRDTSAVYGYQEIRTPIFEHTELFVRGVGDTTDIVGKEMYTFQDKGDRSITLRPEGTASVCRAFLENKLFGESPVHKLYYMGPMFRYERPQKGRYKQFHQYGVEVLGSDDPLVDAEVIALGVRLLEQAGLTDLALHINTVGCPECKPVYRQVLVEYFTQRKESLCASCLERLEKNPLRILDCKNPSCKEAAKDAPILAAHTCPSCSTHYEGVKEYLKAGGISFTEDPRLVRGLDYYTNTAFEIIAENFAAQGTVCGGGRYNGLVGSLGGRDVPGIGFAMGMERILLLQEERNLFPEDENVPEYYIITMDTPTRLRGFQLLQILRNQGYYAEIDYMGKNFKNQLKYADKSGAPKVIIIGEAELEKGSVIVKDMKKGQQTEVSWDAFIKKPEGED